MCLNDEMARWKTCTWFKPQMLLLVEKVEKETLSAERKCRMMLSKSKVGTCLYGTHCWHLWLPSEKDESETRLMSDFIASI